MGLWPTLNHKCQSDKAERTVTFGILSTISDHNRPFSCGLWANSSLLSLRALLPLSDTKLGAHLNVFFFFFFMFILKSKVIHCCIITGKTSSKCLTLSLQNHITQYPHYYKTTVCHRILIQL